MVSGNLNRLLFFGTLHIVGSWLTMWESYAGTVVNYGSLISTMSLDHLAASMGDTKLQQMCKPLFYSSTNVIGVGIRGERPNRIGDKCWVCFLLTAN